MTNIEINETNLDKYGLAGLTGNTREELLSRAAEAAEHGYVLSVTVPDDLVSHNVFESAESRSAECSYTKWVNAEQGLDWICDTHDAPSKYSVNEFSQMPCLAVDPYEVPKVDPNQGPCVYRWEQPKGYPKVTRVQVCLKHHKASKYDTVLNPGMPCLSVDPYDDEMER